MDHDIRRREFLKRAARLAAFGTASLTAGSLGTALARAETLVPSRFRGRIRPFNLVVLGDSIAWGQGLEPNEKYPALVADWLGAELTGAPQIRLFSYAHSGAVLLANPAEDGKPAKFGEVPNDWPSIDAQLTIARNDLQKRGVPLDEVDLVLMDGGINDVNVRNILSPDPAVENEHVRTLTRERCNERMKALLPQVVAGARGFRNAKVVVTNYFPVVSPQSDLTGIGLLLAALGLGAGGWLAMATGVPGTLVAAAAAVPVTAALRRKLAAQSNAFHEVSTAGLRAAVDEANLKRPGSSLFVDVGFQEAHAYAAPDSHLFLVLEQAKRVPSALAIGTPAVIAARARACKLESDPPKFVCLDASMGHPNPKGARRYADAIIAALGAAYPECP